MSLTDGEILELHDLVCGAIDGRLAEPERARLERFLRESEEVRRFYVRMMGLSADIASAAAEFQAEETPCPPAPRRLPWIPLAAAAALLGLAFALWPSGRSEAPEPTTEAVAVLTRIVDAEWDGPEGGPRLDAALSPGWLRLRAGLAQVEFHGGTRVLVEGPAELRLVSAGEAFVRSGRLTALVPPQGRGFRLGTPQSPIVDRGTSFGVLVGPSGTEVHVFSGEVEVGRESLKSGEGLAVEDEGEPRRFPADPSGFTFPSDLAGRSAEAARGRHAAWLAAGARLDEDPSLLVRFDFEGLKSGERTLRNTAEGRAAGDGVIVGCDRAEGRWPGKGALEFRAVSDRVRLDVPGEYRSVTIAAWVRVHGLDRAFNSIFMCEGWDYRDLHWQIRRSGAFDLGIRGSPNEQTGIYHSAVAFGPERFGRWTHVAVVVDADAALVRQYVDGEDVGSKPLRSTAPIRFGPADLGNWNVASSRDGSPIRHFSGRMDEFVLFGRALAEGEVRRLYKEGGP